ncbi:39S ribosomal protein L18, mitochondrial [Habropoda laboriosa]|uniref:Large ribosomal subunit protein uL18m n=1 Tax=Habropoda laboriosa TaxID=597456 RepID=A0A0L7R133_9HYME|nr:PREDICTED: 39S ribosomal protein L18, mitochondrial [Habropoda laboriosa]KOC64558.1 39S ribosomal protein L18, mitochondrial [Habropoda laboriosa]
MSRMCINNLFIKRQIHGNVEIIQNCKEIRNRNPRNLERLRIARKPKGYALDKCGESYWHKLTVKSSQRYCTAEIYHFENGPVISASSQEWGIKKQLYSTNDTTAFKFVGQVLAQRCLESGISEIYVDKSIITGNKIQLLVNELSENGIYLQEPEEYKHPKPTYRYRPEKPWETFE